MENLLYLYIGIILSIFLANENKGSRVELVVLSLISLALFFGVGIFPPLIFLAFILPSFAIARRFNTVGVNKWNALWCFTGIYSFYITCQLIFNSDYNEERAKEKKERNFSKAYYFETIYGSILILITILLILGLIFVRVLRASKSF